jgi:DNA-directed RNA polymerase alpha subunit
MIRESINITDLPVIQVVEEIVKPILEETFEKEEDGVYELDLRPEVTFIVSGCDEECQFILKDVDFDRGDAARIRQIIMSSLESMAIEIVEIIENTTDLQDESIALRLGLVPIKCINVEDIPLIKDTKNIKDETRAGVPFSINVTNPSSSKSTYSVTEKDINIKDKRCRTVTSGTPLFKLRPGQSFELVGLIQKGTGKMHAKWQPTTNVKFSYDEKENKYILSLETNNRVTCREVISRSLYILEQS